jgi:hypothetical protein
MITTTATAGEVELAGWRCHVAELYATNERPS